MPTSSIHFTPSRTKKNGMSSMKPTSDICPSVCVTAVLVTADLVQERVRERVVELQRDADEERPEHEDRERPVLHQLQRVEAEDVAHRDRVPQLGRRRVRQREREEPERQRRARRQPELQRQRLGTERADDDSPATIQPIVPSTRMPGNSCRGSFIWWNDERVGQRERRHVAERVGQQHPVEAAEVAGASTPSRAAPRRSGAAPRGSSRWRRSGPPPCRRRTATRSPPAPSSRTPAPLWVPEKFSVFSKYVPIVTYHAPQTKNCRNIITESLSLMVCVI